MLKNSHYKRAFTLTELSLVLVVIAGLIGIIFVGARKMSEQARTTETVLILQKFSERLKDYLSQFNENHAIFANDYKEITPNILPPVYPPNDVVPSELKIAGTTEIYSPYGQVNDTTASIIRPYTFANKNFDKGIGGPYYGLYITDLNYNRCVNLITTMASTDSLVQQYGIIRVQVNSYLNQLPDTVNDINITGSGYVPLNKITDSGVSAYSCKKTGLNYVLFAYRLH